MKATNTLLLQRKDVAGLLTIEECIVAVENAFRLYAEGKCTPPKVLGIHANEGGFHIKAGILDFPMPVFVAKINSNFPGNPKQNELPTIQGIIAVYDSLDGRLLALMDSVEITILRTGAATAIAAKYLAQKEINAVTICGCGNQGKISLKALMKVRSLKKVFAFDTDEGQLRKFSSEFDDFIKVIPVMFDDLPKALLQSGICVTCTPSREPFLSAEHIMPGTFIAAIGSDSEDKRELCADLWENCKIVVDLVDQASVIGELHHAIRKDNFKIENVHSELGEIVAGKKRGRESDKEMIIFDSTGMALQDVAAASIVYEKAIRSGIGTMLNFSSQPNDQKNTVMENKNQKAIAILKSWFPFR